MSGALIDLTQAVELTRTGDLWLFRGHSAADRAIRLGTNSPVNHVGMTVTVDDLPPMIWHAELGRSLPDLWTGRHQRGVQLHDLSASVQVWAHRYGQRAWLRQLEPAVGPEQEDAVLRCVARLDGAPFPPTARLAGRWLRARILRKGDSTRHAQGPPAQAPALTGDRRLETVYCAEVVAITYQAMGLLRPDRRPSWYDPGRFWSGDDLGLTSGYRLGGELAVRVPGPSPL